MLMPAKFQLNPFYGLQVGEVKNFFGQKWPRPIPFMVVMKYTYVQVSAPCIAWFASLRSEEVVLGKSA